MNKYTLEIGKDEFEIDLSEEEREINLNAEDTVLFDIDKENNKTVIRGIDRTYKMVVKINSVDLLSLEAVQRARVLEDYYKSIKNFNSKFKIITFSNKYSFVKQINYLEQKYLNEENTFFKTEIRREIAKLEKVQKDMKISFYAFVFGTDKTEAIENYKKFIMNFSSTIFEVEELESREIIKLIKKLNNL